MEDYTTSDWLGRTKLLEIKFPDFSFIYENANLICGYTETNTCMKSTETAHLDFLSLVRSVLFKTIGEETKRFFNNFRIIDTTDKFF